MSHLHRRVRRRRGNPAQAHAYPWRNGEDRRRDPAPVRQQHGQVREGGAGSNYEAMYRAKQPQPFWDSPPLLFSSHVLKACSAYFFFCMTRRSHALCCAGRVGIVLMPTVDDAPHAFGGRAQLCHPCHPASGHFMFRLTSPTFPVARGVSRSSVVGRRSFVRTSAGRGTSAWREPLRTPSRSTS